MVEVISGGWHEGRRVASSVDNDPLRGSSYRRKKRDSVGVIGGIHLTRPMAATRVERNSFRSERNEFRSTRCAHLTAGGPNGPRALVGCEMGRMVEIWGQSNESLEGRRGQIG
jgi:hypothetical protein